MIPVTHYQTFKERYTKGEEDKKFIYLFPAPTRTHGEVIEMFFNSSGYRFKSLPVEDEKAQKTGLKYVNRGQCAPVAYLTGNLINFLTDLRQGGMSNEEILNRYAFLMIKTSGGACRLPAYEEEYRKALKQVGLEYFVIELLDIGLSTKSTSALKLDKQFFMRIFQAVMVADILNDMERRIRPYEVNKGETEQVFAEVRQIIGKSYDDNDNNKLLN